MTPEHWQQIKHLVNSALQADSQSRTRLLQQSCVDDFAMRLGAEALLSRTRKLPEQPLSPDAWQHIEQVFQAALEVTPSNRPAFLAQACNGDDNLRHEVESLLIYQGAAGALIGGAVHEAAGLLPNDEKARFTPGTTLNKRYRILGLLGKGGMGEVYRADDLTLQQPVALKFLTEKLSQDKAMLARFRSEVAVAHRVTHPNVCRVHDIGEVITSAGTLQFLSMEYVDGEDLSSLLRRIGRLPSDKAVEIAQQLCAGLASAHEAGVLHRDLKPANVMIDGKGRVRITDFGLAGFAEQIKGSEVMAGTPAYMSPEQFAGKEVSTKSDIYALGLVLYEVFTGKRVFEAGSLEELKQMHESSAPANPSSWVKDLDPLVERVILRCLEKDPAKRLASAKQVADALPGGDPLAAALALGETPSPEMVAAAGGSTGLRPKVAVACLAGVIALMLVFVWTSGKVTLLSKLPMDIPPDALARKAREVAAKVGYPDKPFDTAHGFAFDGGILAFASKEAKQEEFFSNERLATGRLVFNEYWYRESPEYMSGRTASYRITVGKVTPTDPPHIVSGMRIVRLDTMGRLRYFSAVPAQIELSSPTANEKPFNWAELFAAAELDQAQFTTTTPQWTPPQICDERAAWTGTYPDLPQIPIRLEAAAYRGKLVYFQLIEPWTTPDRLPAPQEKGTLIGFLIPHFIGWGIWIISMVMAWTNYRNGRGDRQGSFRLAVFFALQFLFCWFLMTNHTPSQNEVENWWFAFYQALILGFWFGIFNLAIEPFIRRQLPEALITWNRLLAGRFRDPRVGRDVLVGLLAGFGAIVVASVIGMFSPMVSPPLASSHHLLGGRFALAWLVDGLRPSLAFGTMFLLLYFLLHLVLRKKQLVVIGIVLILTAYNLSMILTSTNPIQTGLLTSFVMGVFAFLLLRFGLLAGCILFFTIGTLAIFPVTANFSVWYSGIGLLAAGVLLALAGYAFYTSLGGQKVFTGKLLEE